MTNSQNVEILEYKSGWYQIEFSQKIKKGKIYSFNFFDKSLVCLRIKNNIVKVYDAHCPHLGAHLGVGGKIQKDLNLICPFHGWKFNAERGDCVEIPYCKIIPKKAKLRTYPVKEINGNILFYYSQNPQEPDDSVELTNPKYCPVQVKKLNSIRKLLGL